MFERTTRLWAMSPTIATVRPAIRPLWRRMVSASSSAWVGCSCEPSPALTTPAVSSRASIPGTPTWRWRTTTKSGNIEAMLRAVSRSVSPFACDERSTEKLTMSADSRCAAISNETRVRVEFSKKRLTTVLPRSVGTFLTGRSATSANDSAVERISSISAVDSSSMPSRSLRVQPISLMARPGAPGSALGRRRRSP